jgi:HAMP domain-containing protein
LDVYARLKPGVSLAQASEDMSRIAAQIKREQTESNSGAAVLVLSLQDDLSGAIRPALLTLLVAVGFVLLIACVNVANLLLARATSRGKELATRIALGAGKARLMRQMLTESILLSFAGGCAGLLVASWTRRLLLAFRPESLPQFNVIETDGRVLLFTLAVCVGTGLLFGLLPALRSSTINLNHAASRYCLQAPASRFAVSSICAPPTSVSAPITPRPPVFLFPTINTPKTSRSSLFTTSFWNVFAALPGLNLLPWSAFFRSPATILTTAST